MAKWDLSKLPEGRAPLDHAWFVEKARANDMYDDLTDYIEELEAKLAKAMLALDEAIYLLDPDEEDIAKETGLYRIVTIRAELKGEKPTA